MRPSYESSPALQRRMRRQKMSFLKLAPSSSSHIDPAARRARAQKIANSVPVDVSSPMSFHSAAHNAFADFATAFEEDPFAENSFATDWPSMPTMPANSSMQSSFPSRQQQTPSKPQTPAAPSSPPPSNSAAARRRMRSQLRQTPPRQSSARRVEEAPPPPSSAPPSTPPRRHTPTTPSKATPYTPEVVKSTRSIQGFSFDAFGLDGTQINQDIAKALQDWESCSTSTTPTTERGQSPVSSEYMSSSPIVTGRYALSPKPSPKPPRLPPLQPSDEFGSDVNVGSDVNFGSDINVGSDVNFGSEAPSDHHLYKQEEDEKKEDSPYQKWTPNWDDAPEPPIRTESRKQWESPRASKPPSPQSQVGRALGASTVERPWKSKSQKFVKAGAAPTTRSEGGASVRHDHVAKVLQRLSPRDAEDAKSDVGDSCSNTPIYANVKLRKTGFSIESPDVPMDEPATPRQLTYRERRELELQKEQESKTEEPAPQPKVDVQAQIKRRIAANKRAASLRESPESLPREVVRESAPVKTPPVTRSPLKSPSRLSVVEKPSELVVEPSAPEPEVKKSTMADAGSAISRHLMLQQLQKRQPKVGEDEVVSHAPSDDGASRGGHSSATPKATKMMLNAFLAGRDSLGDGLPKRSVGEEIVLEPSESEITAGSTSALPALKDDPKYTRYFKMLSIGMPMDVVKHAMSRDGFDPSVMDGDHSKPAGIPLKEDPLYKKYFKMLSIGMPMEAVKHAMQRDGLDSSVMDQDHNLPAASGAKGGQGGDQKEEDSHRRARLHWKTLGKVTSNSLWAQIDKDIALENIEIDEEEFQELFQVEKGVNATIAKAVAATTEKRATSVRVIDPKRANNGGIILARLKMSHDEMADAVDRINEKALSSEQIENIIEYLPTKEERKALEAYMLEGGQDAAEKFDGLCECEKFMVSMMTVKHAKQKVRALLFKLQFESCLEDIYNDTVLIETACDELKNSTRLRQLLGIILAFGNRLNTAGNGKRRAGAFTLDSLLKLNQAKAFDKKTTFLHYIVHIVRRNNEPLLHFKDDLPTISKADKVFWDQCLSDLEEVENQLENIRKISLYQARQHSKAYRIRRKKQREDDGDESLSEDDESLTLEEEVAALRATQVGLFTLTAIKYVSSLREKVEQTKEKFSRLLEYFGEEEGRMQPHEMFAIMVSFCRDFGKAVELVTEKERRKNREQKKSNARPAGKPPTHSPLIPERKAHQTSMLRASNLQPNMSSVIKEMRATPQRPPPTSPEPSDSRAQHASITSRSHESQLSSVAQSSSPKDVSHARRMDEPTQQRNGFAKPVASSHIGGLGRSGLGQARPAEQRQPSASPPTTSASKMAAMRHKARLHRNRQRSSEDPVDESYTASTSNTSTDSVRADDMHSRRNFVDESDGATQPNDPRASIRNRRRVELARNRFRSPNM